MPDSKIYQEKKAFFDGMLTIYGRNAVREALQDTSLPCHCLHLAESNREAGVVAELRSLAEGRGITVKVHTRVALARISRNGKQDQGVAADVVCPGFRPLETFLEDVRTEMPLRVLALDGITNPQNLGMIIRSAAAGNIQAILWSKRGNAALGPLVIKASTGTIYRAPLVICEDLPRALRACRDQGMDVCTLEANASESLFGAEMAQQTVYVLGNESEGVSRGTKEVANRALAIPMNNAVESLNVAVTAALIAYASGIAR